MQPYGDNFAFVIPVDERLHTPEKPFCWDSTCGCHEDALSQARVTLMQQTISGLLSHPCAERIIATTSIQVTWTCQFVRYDVPNLPRVKVLHVQVVGKAILLEIVFVARPRIFVGK